MLMIMAWHSGSSSLNFQAGGKFRCSDRDRISLFLAFVMLATLFGASCRRGGERAFKRDFETGLEYFGQEKYEAASIEFRKAMQIEPKAWAPRYYLALSALKLRRWQDAYKELNAVIELQPSLSAARLELADLLLLGNKTSAAREQIDAVLGSSPRNVRAQALLGKAYFAEKDYPRAVEEFEKAKQLAPQDPALWLACGLAKVSAKQPALAEKDFRRAVELDPRSAEAYRDLANLFRLTGRVGEVEPLLHQGLKVNPHSQELHLTLADFYFQQGRLNEIEKLFSQMRGHAADFPYLHLQLGDFWMWRSEPARGVKEYEAALVPEKPDLLLRKKLIGAYITLGRWDDAERLNQQILARNPKDLEGRSFRGALRYLRGDSAGAVGELRAVLKDEPESLIANYYLGLALMASGKPDEAEAALAECVRYNENSVYAFQRLAELRFRRQDWDAGLEYAKRVVALTPQLPDGYLLAAEAYINKGDSRKAQEILQGVQKMAPDSADAQELLGAANIKQGKIEAGVNEYEQAWARSPDPVARVNRFVDLLVARGQPDVALRSLQRLVASHPQASFYEVLARVYLVKGDLAAAEAACQQALRLDGSRWIPHSYLGEVYVRLHRPDEALAQLDEVIRRQPKQIPPYIVAGDIWLRQGKFDKARSYYEAARKQDPDSLLAQNSLARLWAEEGNHLDEAMATIQGLQHKFPDDPYLSDTLAWIYYLKGIYPSALPLLKRSVEQQPNNALFRFHLGMAYAGVGETNLSRQELEAALKLGLDSARWETAARDALARSQTKARDGVAVASPQKPSLARANKDQQDPRW